MYIYKTTNKINNKIYIGKSSKSINESMDYFGSGVLISAAIKKYGIDNFSKEILEEVSHEDINHREKFWIAYFNSRDLSIGYNLSDGGDGGDNSKFINYVDPEYKRKISNAQRGEKNHLYGKKYTRDELIKMKFIKMGEDNHMFGKHHSEERKQLLSEAMTGDKNPNYGKVWCVEKCAKNKSGKKMFKSTGIPDGWITCTEFDELRLRSAKRRWFNDGTKSYLISPQKAQGLNKGRLSY